MEANLRSYKISLFQRIIYFPNNFMKHCKDNSNEAQFIPLEVKNKIKQMAMEQGLYSQVVNLHRNNLEFIASNKNKIEAKFKFQGLSAR